MYFSISSINESFVMHISQDFLGLLASYHLMVEMLFRSNEYTTLQFLRMVLISDFFHHLFTQRAVNKLTPCNCFLRMVLVSDFFQQGILNHLSLH